MAPSPTGFLHIGGVRTFLFNWLFARGRGGECLLRIENTDTSREVAESVEQIQSSLALARDRLGRAGRPSSSTGWSAAARRRGGSSRRERRTRTRARSASACPTRATTGWDDAVKGRIEFPNEQLEDLVLVRSDGRPTYNFASPVEDWLDGITHVIRGDDHVSNTPKQIRILRALGAELPVYAHVPNVFGDRRQEALEAPRRGLGRRVPRRPGTSRRALMNFLALLGWAPDGETTIMSRDELVERFSLERVGASPATFDYAKLDWMNGVYLRELSTRRVRGPRWSRYLREQGYDWDEERVRAAAPLVQEKIARLGEFPGFAGFLFGDVEPDPELLDPSVLAAAAEALEQLEPFARRADRDGAEGISASGSA